MRTIFLAGLCGLAAISLVSCALPRIRSYYETPRSLDFTQGSYLVNHITSNLDWEDTERLAEKLMKGLKRIGGDSVFYIGNLEYTALLTPEYFQPDPTVEELNYIYEATGFDFSFFDKLCGV